MKPKTRETKGAATAASTDGLGDRCLVCNGIGGHEEGCRGTSAYDELREAILRLRIEVNCRIEHGAESGGHLEYVQTQLDSMLMPNETGQARREQPKT
jgi:hypothetical protein